MSKIAFKYPLWAVSKKKSELELKIPTWRPDITQPIDIVEEIVRIKGYDHIKTIDPEKTRLRPTLNKTQKLFHFLQRSVASKGYVETVTWSFTDEKINNYFRENKNQIDINNIIELISQTLEYLRKRSGNKVIWDWNPPIKSLCIPMNSTLISWTIENIAKNGIPISVNDTKGYLIFKRNSVFVYVI